MVDCIPLPECNGSFCDINMSYITCRFCHSDWVYILFKSRSLICVECGRIIGSISKQKLSDLMVAIEL